MKLKNRIDKIFELDCSKWSFGIAYEDFYFVNPMEEEKILKVLDLIKKNLEKALQSKIPYINTFAYLLKNEPKNFGIERSKQNLIGKRR